MKLSFSAPPAALVLAFALAAPSDARACGGCFHPPVLQGSESTVVTGHRMAFSSSPARTILWDQISYAGDPKDFAWVLPVRAGAVLEASNDAWFETLEAATATHVESPVFHCPEITRPQSGCGCVQVAMNEAGGGGAGGAGSGGVQVLHQGTVGPYETVTLATDTPGALNDWLTQHGYNVDPDVQPVIDAYVSEGFDFIALRLQPGQGVRAMKPVRVVTPGAGLTLPLRMVAAGTGAHVAITLYAMTEGRLEIDKYANARVPADALVWDFATMSSNYAAVRADTLAKNAGLTWLTTFAAKGALLSPLPDAAGGYQLYAAGYDEYGGTQYTDTVSGAYVAQGVANGETTETSCSDALGAVAESAALVVDPCPAGAPPDDPSCGEVAVGQIDARGLACGALDDFKAVLTGMHPRDVWVTRLEADLPRLALKSDLTLRPAADQAGVGNHLLAPTGIHGDDQCPTSVPPISMIAPGYRKGADRTGLFGYALMGLLVAGTLARRRFR